LRAVGVARCQLKKCTFRWKARQIALWWDLHGFCYEAVSASRGCVGQCEGIRKPVHPSGATGASLVRLTTSAEEQNASTFGWKANTKAPIHRSHFSVVKTLGAWLCVRREATPPGHAANTESVKNPWARDAISSKSERGTGARDWSSRWQKPIVRITRVDRATSQDEARQPNASRRPPWNTAWRGPWPKPRRRGVRSADVFN